MARATAPGELAKLESFLNTVDIEGGEEELTDAQRLAAWLADHGLVEVGISAGNADLAAAIELREAFRAQLAARHDPAASWAAASSLDRLAAGLPLRVGVGTARSRLVPLEGGVRGALAALVAIAHDAMVDGTWERLKVCQSDRCRFAFYDASRNRSGTWCSMQVCGNRAKVRTYRQRRTSGGAPAN